MSEQKTTRSGRKYRTREIPTVESEDEAENVKYEKEFSKESSKKASARK
jgi:hypothetical protein